METVPSVNEDLNTGYRMLSIFHYIPTYDAATIVHILQKITILKNDIHITTLLYDLIDSNCSEQKIGNAIDQHSIVFRNERCEYGLR